MSNEEAYVSSLQRQLSESRAAAERRCKDNDAMIDKYYTYESTIIAANDLEANASSAEAATQEVKGEFGPLKKVRFRYHSPTSR